MIPINAWIIQSKEEVDNILLQGGKIILLTEDTPEYLRSPQYGSSCIVANCLLPNYEAVSHYIENDMQGFIRAYTENLSYPESMVYFVTLISAILNNIPLGFVFGNEEIEQVASVHFLNFFANLYGIHLGHNFPFAGMNPTVGWMDRNYTANNMTLLYNNNLLTPQEFLFVYPIEAKLDINTLQKLLFELRPPIQNPTDMSAVEQYFNEFRTSLKNAKRVLVDPMVMV